MADILLIEPGYSNKYPPLGLMKISYFHKYILNDYVRFAKGELPETFKDKKWDRVYVTTLFTFEWEKTKKALEYALSVAKDPKEVYTGGILATLMPELIAQNFPTIKNNPGLLNHVGTLGLPGEECIDTLTPDYSILDDIADEYVYPAHDAYFTYMTRGCGMKCQFCAVQTLEPTYKPYLSITENIQHINELFGEKKDLLLMDNNVLKSPQFDTIIDEIKSLGFSKGATYKNPRTGKQVQRYVDFNQGLDANLLTPHKAKRLAELAIRPARIAFDHIEDETKYKQAIRLCAENGITHMSNYLLYNGDSFSGKGQSYHADTPSDLYERMRITMDLGEELSQELGHRIAIFSFPMRYIPLSDLRRGYVGSQWNPKYLRALQRMLIPTQGKGVSSRSFFEAAFGTSKEEFVQFLAMPEDHLGWRGHFVTKKEETAKEKKARRVTWEENHQYIEEWTQLFTQLGSREEHFISAISDNNNKTARYLTLTDPLEKKLFIHYFTIPMLLKTLSILDAQESEFIVEYISIEFPLMYKRMIEYISTVRIPYSLLEGVYKIYKQTLVADIFKELSFKEPELPFIIKNLIKIQAKTKLRTFDFELITFTYLFSNAGVFTPRGKSYLIKSLKSLDEKSARSLLLKKFNCFKTNITNTATEQGPGHEYVIEQLNTTFLTIKKRLSQAGE